MHDQISDDKLSYTQSRLAVNAFAATVSYRRIVVAVGGRRDSHLTWRRGARCHPARAPVHGDALCDRVTMRAPRLNHHVHGRSVHGRGTGDTIRYYTIGDAILTCARKPT